MIALQSELQQRHGVNVKFSSFDFAAPDLHSRAHAVLSSAVGIDRISVLVNNVGYLSDIPEPFLDHPPGYVDRLITVRPSKNCLLSFFADMYAGEHLSNAGDDSFDHAINVQARRLLHHQRQQSVCTADCPSYDSVFCFQGICDNLYFCPCGGERQCVHHVH